MNGEFFAADVEGAESVGAVGAVFEQVFFRLHEFFAGLVLAEAVATTRHSGRLYGEDKVFIVGAVEERHQALLTCEALIDEQVFFIVAHRVSEIDGFDTPTVQFELVANDIVEILLVDSIVGVKGGGVVVIYDGLVAVVLVVVSEVGDERGYLALEFGVE